MANNTKLAHSLFQTSKTKKSTLSQGSARQLKQRSKLKRIIANCVHSAITSRRKWECFRGKSILIWIKYRKQRLALRSSVDQWWRRNLWNAKVYQGVKVQRANQLARVSQQAEANHKRDFRSVEKLTLPCRSMQQQQRCSWQKRYMRTTAIEMLSCPLEYQAQSN